MLEIYSRGDWDVAFAKKQPYEKAWLNLDNRPSVSINREECFGKETAIQSSLSNLNYTVIGISRWNKYSVELTQDQKDNIQKNAEDRVRENNKGLFKLHKSKQQLRAEVESVYQDFARFHTERAEEVITFYFLNEEDAVQFKLEWV